MYVGTKKIISASKVTQIVIMEVCTQPPILVQLVIKK